MVAEAVSKAATNAPQHLAAETLSEAERVERLVSDTGVMRILSDYPPPAVSSDGSTRRCSHCGATYPGDVTTCYSCNIELGPAEDKPPPTRRLNADEHQFDVRSVTKPPDLILDSTPVSEVVEHFANDQDPFALVVDEYETIIGMVTPKDVLLKLEKK